MSARARSQPLTTKEAAELKAHHLACSQLVRGCQAAIFRLRNRADCDLTRDPVSFRAVEMLEDIVGSWCETLAILRTALNVGPWPRSVGGMDSPDHAGTTNEANSEAVARFAWPPVPSAGGDQPAP